MRFACYHFEYLIVSLRLRKVLVHYYKVQPSTTISKTGKIRAEFVANHFFLNQINLVNETELKLDEY
jgi:hypothetical protein